MIEQDEFFGPLLRQGEKLFITVQPRGGEPKPSVDALERAFAKGEALEMLGQRWRVTMIDMSTDRAWNPRGLPTFELTWCGEVKS